MSAMFPIAPVIRIGFIFYKCYPKDCIATILFAIFQLPKNIHFWLNIRCTDQTKNIDALAEIVGKNKAEKVYLAVRREKNKERQGKALFRNLVIRLIGGFWFRMVT
jgi:hypothetical protein